MVYLVGHILRNFNGREMGKNSKRGRVTKTFHNFGSFLVNESVKLTDDQRAKSTLNNNQTMTQANKKREDITGLYP